MKRLTAILCLTITVLFGSAGLFSAPANAESKYVPLTDEQIDRVFSGMELVEIPDAYRFESWSLKFLKSGDWEGSHPGNLGQVSIAWGEWSSKNGKLCL